MPTDLVSAIYLLARIMMGGAFAFAGVRNLRHLERLTGIMAGRGVPMAKAVTLFGILVQLTCGALVAIGVFTPWAALGEALFLAAATLIVHPYWAFPKDERAPHINACIVNTALVGGFLMLFATTL